MGSTRHDIGNHLQILASLATDEPYVEGEPSAAEMSERFAVLLAACSAVYRMARPSNVVGGALSVSVNAFLVELQRVLPQLGVIEKSGMSGPPPCVSVDAAVRVAVATVLLHRCMGSEEVRVSASFGELGLSVRIFTPHARPLLRLLGNAERLADALDLTDALLGPAGATVDASSERGGFEVCLPPDTRRRAADMTQAGAA